MGMDKWPFFEKTYPPIWLKLAQNIIFGPIIMMKKVSVHIFMKKNFHGAKIEIFGPAHMPTGIKGATDHIYCHERPQMTLNHSPHV